MVYPSRIQGTRYTKETCKWCTSRHYIRLSVDTFSALLFSNPVHFLGTTYPLDLVRSRLSIATASLPTASLDKQPSLTSASLTQAKKALSSAYHTSTATLRFATLHPTALSPADLTMWGMTLKVMREEGGVRGLYRGLVATAMGVAPYVGINFAAYEALRTVITPPGKASVMRKLACGALAGLWLLYSLEANQLHSQFRVGSISQTLTYPFDVLRRKMQVVGMRSGNLGYKYDGALDALRVILRTEGVVGLYRGLWPNLREHFSDIFASMVILIYHLQSKLPRA